MKLTMQILATKEKYGIKINLHDFSQKSFETFQKKTIEASSVAFVAFSEREGVTAVAVVRGETVRVAITTGILSGLSVEDVNELKPYVVAWIADEVRAHVTAVTTAPPDPN